MPTFDGANLFGGAVKVIGPTGSYRTIREVFPGVDGARLYRMGGGTKVWTIAGRLESSTIAGLKTALAAGVAKVDGQLYAFVDNDGSSYANCQLNDYRQAGPVTAINGGFTMTITATVEQLANG